MSVTVKSQNCQTDSLCKKLDGKHQKKQLEKLKIITLKTRKSKQERTADCLER